MKLGICLSGGGARGIAHLGVLKALEEHQIFPNYVSGASAGSIAGALYCAGKSNEEILEIVKTTNLFKIFTFGFVTGGLAKHTYLRNTLKEKMPFKNFEDLPSHLYVCVSNINKGRWTIIKEGNIVEAVVASSSIPLVFEPVEINGNLYVDGGLLNNFPIEPLIVECDMVIGVNVMPNAVKKDISGLRSVAERCFDLVVWNNSETRTGQADVLIEIDGIDEYGIFDFEKAEEIVELGYREALKQIEEIKERIAELQF